MTNNLNMFMFASNRDFGKLFTVKHKRVCVRQASQPASGAVSAAANVNEYSYMHMHVRN